MRMLIRAALIAVLTASIAAVGEAATVVAKTGFAIDSTKVREAECTAGDIVADAVRRAGRADIGLVQANQLRQKAVIPAGQVTADALTDLLLYPDEHVVTTKLSGAQLQEALERSLSMLPRPSTGFLQVSGLSVTYRSAQPSGARLVSVKVAAASLDANNTYTVAMPASLAKGDQGYFRIFQKLKTEEGPSMGQAFVDYVQTGLKAAPRLDRLRDLSKPAQ